VKAPAIIMPDNGKAERFIQSALREWAYAQAYPHSRRRTAELPRWLHRYNWHRPHASLNAKPPISRLGLSFSMPISCRNAHTRTSSAPKDAPGSGSQ